MMSFDFLRLPSYYGLNIALPVVGVAGAVIAFLFHLKQSIQWPGEAPVRWSWLPFLGFALDLGQKPYELLKESADMFEGVFGIIVGGQRMFFISDSHSSDLILKPCKSLTWKEFHSEVLENVFLVHPSSLSEDVIDEDLIRKSYVQHLLSDKYLHIYTQRMEAQLLKSIANIKDGEVPLYETLARIIFTASICALFNDTVTNFDELFAAFVAFDEAFPLCAAGISLKYFPKAFKGHQVLQKLTSTCTENLSPLLAFRQNYFMEREQKGLLLPNQTSIIQIPMLWASVGNTMPTAFWLVYYLLTHPEAHSAVLAEIATHFPSLITADSAHAIANGALSQDKLNQMYFLDACITETLRLTSGSMIMRDVKESTEFTLASTGKTFRLRKGDKVGLYPPLYHFDEDIFPQAKQFRPQRWYDHCDPTVMTPEEQAYAVCGKIPMQKDGKMLSSSSIFLPFGAGITYCPGRRFARNELKIIAILLLTQVDTTILKEYQGQVQPVPVINGGRAGIGIFPPKHDLMVKMVRK